MGEGGGTISAREGCKVYKKENIKDEGFCAASIGTCPWLDDGKPMTAWTKILINGEREEGGTRCARAQWAREIESVCDPMRNLAPSASLASSFGLRYKIRNH